MDVENLPPGWIKRRSGILVPHRRQRGRPLLAVAILLGSLTFASPVASGLSAVARAIVDVAQAVSVFTDRE
jgi:hypothetical protein